MRILFIFLGIILCVFFTNVSQSVNAEGLLEKLNSDFHYMKNVNDENRAKFNPTEKVNGSVQAELNQLKAEKKKELENVEKQISTKQAQIRQINLNKDLNISQKKSRTAVLEKELSTLKATKQNIEKKYKERLIEIRGF